MPLEERVLRGVVVDLRIDQPEAVPAVDHRRVLEEHGVRDADLLRVEVPRLVLAEDVAAKTREERVHVVCVTGRRLRHRDGEVLAALRLEGESLLLEVRERLRNRGQPRVHDEADVLERDGRAVEPLDRRPVGERVERVLRELPGVACFGEIGSTRPSAASWPVQSCAPMITSGALAAATVLSWSRMSPKFFTTTSTCTPRLDAQALAIFSMSARRSLSVQIRIVPPAAELALTAPDAGTAAATVASIATTTQAPNAVLLLMWCLLQVDPTAAAVEQRFMPLRQPGEITPAGWVESRG